MSRVGKILCFPTHIMQIAEGVDVQHVGEAGGKHEVLQKAGEHMPGVALGREDVSKFTTA